MALGHSAAPSPTLFLPTASARRRLRTLDGSTRATRDARRLIRYAVVLSLLALTLLAPATARARKKHRPPPSGHSAVVVDERLAALRDAPELSANLLRRLGRGRFVSVTGERTSREGLTFYRVAVTSRTSGWIQTDAVVRPSRAGDDARLLRLVRASEEFDRLARARIFLDAFPRSPLRPAVLLVFGDAAEEAAAKLSREARRRLDAREMEAGGAPVASYFLNFSALDRYNRSGVKFVFDSSKRELHYDGAAWRELVRRYPQSAEAAEARKRLGDGRMKTEGGRVK
ncbi:MAG: hypothetical protein M3444_03015 [Acidobacteriota bacterium]|nr:hypothetical protein [Acidobacteriota bacterium]MDQ5836399.1 hypothetical protein [Acidobacteriota bacterium]